MITQPESATRMPIAAYCILRLAVSAVPSSPADRRYWKPEMTKAMIARKPKIPKSQSIILIRRSAIGILDSPVPAGKHTPPFIVPLGQETGILEPEVGFAFVCVLVFVFVLLDPVGQHICPASQLADASGVALQFIAPNIQVPV